MNFADYLRGKKSLEVGGPSGIFDYWAIYNSVKSIDGTNFSTDTVWGTQSNVFVANQNITGNLYICEGTDLKPIADNSYELVLSSNNLEHIANPLKALKEWTRVLVPGGLIFLVLPKKEFTFDHLRQTTKIQHLIEDYENNIGEDDLTHLIEILALHDLNMDPPAGSFSNFRERSLKNLENRCLHHHVFDEKLLYQIFEYLKFEAVHVSNVGESYIGVAKVNK